MFNKKRGYTLIELLITFTIFTAVAMISLVVMTNILKSTKRIRTQVFLYTEAQALMDQIAHDIQRNTVDYEGYYARNVRGEAGWAAPDYGLYGQSFYHPGDAGGPDLVGPYAGINGYGAFCGDGFSAYPDACLVPNQPPISDSLDYDTGAHPFTGISSVDGSYGDDPTFMNAMCESKDSSCDDLIEFMTDELLLVNADGDERIVILREQSDDTGADFRMAKVMMLGVDTNSDGVEDSWSCSSDFVCTGADFGPDPADLTDSDMPGSNFLSLSTSVLDIQDFKVFINPIEDPYRAFAEPGSGVQVQPQITILLTAGLADSYSGGILGSENVTITIQRTISTGVYSEVTSYK